MQSEKVLLVVNGNKSIGYGHISRIKIVAEELKLKGFDICFLTLIDCPFINELEKSSLNILQVTSFNNSNQGFIIHFLEKNDIHLVLIDLIETEYLDLSWIRELQPQLFIVSITLFLFDYDKRYEHLSFFPDLDNSLSGVYKGRYGFFNLHSGVDYFTFREEFRNLVPNIRETANTILITMGGSDPFGITLKVLKAIQNLEYKITIILSEISSTFEEVKEIVAYDSKLTLFTKSESIAQQMLNSDLLIINGGLTRYEACLSGIPFIALSIHKKQYLITEKLTNKGVGINLGIVNELTELMIKKSVVDLMDAGNKRKEMSAKMRGLFDYNGAQRIVEDIVKAKREHEKSN